jgi:hypothetical protein
MAELRWHEAAPVRFGARAAQLLILALVCVAVGPVGVGLVLLEGDVRFTVTKSELVVDVDPGILGEQRRVPLDSIRRVELARFPLEHRIRGTGKPGHCSGWFRRGELGRVWEASACTAETVVVRLPDEIWTLGPADREGFARALRTREPGVFEPPPPPPAPVWWRALQFLIVALLALPLLILAAVLVPIRYAASHGQLHVRSPLGTRRYDIAGGRASVVEDPKLGLRLFGMGLPGAWIGIFRVDGETTRVWATRSGGRAVLLQGSKRVMITPASPESLLADLRAAGAR